MKHSVPFTCEKKTLTFPVYDWPSVLTSLRWCAYPLKSNMVGTAKSLSLR